MAEKRVSSVGARAVAGTRVGGAVPANIPPLLRRFWDYARNMARKFSQHLLNSEEHEEEFLKVIRRDFEKWE